MTDESRDRPADVEKAAPADDALPPALAWAGVAALTLSAAAAAWLECLLVPLYVGTAVVPVAVVLALAGNWFLPRMARTLLPSTVAAALPLLGWLAVMLLLGLNSRPEGDVVLPGGGGWLEYTAYGVLLGGTLSGTVSVVTAAPVQAGGRR